MDREITRFKSRRNAVLLVQTDEGTVVRKQYPQEERCLRERMVYEKLRGSSLPHAQLLCASARELTMTWLPGCTLLEVLERQESTGVLCRAAWDQLARWLTEFQKETGLTVTDVNLRNFLYEESGQTLWGVDFEECGEESLVVIAGRVAAYILHYAPEETPLKLQTAEYVLQQFSGYLNIAAEELRREAKTQEALLLRHRKNRT